MRGLVGGGAGEGGRRARGRVLCASVGEAGRELELNSNSKTLFYKDCNLGK